jgi:putative adenylate-forming enzyme
VNTLPALLLNYWRARHGRRFETRAALEAWQERQVRRHIRWTMAHSGFYAGHFRGLDLAAWRDFPTIDKALMMAEFDRLNTRGIDRDAAMHVAVEAERSRDFSPMIGDLTVGLSSGTSGNRGLFLVSPAERAAWAGSILGKILPGSILHRHRIAFFLRANSNLYTTVSGRRIRFAFFDLLDALERHIERLNDFQPTSLVAPPSMLRFLAEAKVAGRLTIAPTKIVSVAEVLDPIDEAVIARAFGQTVHQVYQCTEGFLAATCAHGTLHLNEDLVVIQKEVIDAASGKFVPIITDFTRTTQPILRYRLNDLLTERKEPCPCGSVFTALEQIEGRCDDVFYLPAVEGDRLVPVFPDFIRRAVMTASAEIQEYTTLQTAPGQLEVALRVPAAHRGEAESQVVETLGALFDSLDVARPQVRFTPYDQAPGLTKLRRVERRFQPETTPV